MKHFILSVVFLALAVSAVPAQIMRFPAPEGQPNARRLDVTDDHVILKPGLEPLDVVQPQDLASPDLTFRVNASEAGVYQIRSVVSVTDEGKDFILQAKSKFGGLPAFVQINDQPVVSVFLASPPIGSNDLIEKELGKLKLKEGENVVKIWLPKHVKFVRLLAWRDRGPKVPEAAENYVPAIVPPKSHPRLWFTAQTLPKLRSQLELNENAVAWETVRTMASREWPKEETWRTQSDMERNIWRKPEQKLDADGNPLDFSCMAVGYDSKICAMAQFKAFKAVMTDDEALARDTIVYFTKYFRRVDFGNVLDITRETGTTIYTAALIYDWLYDRLTPEERAFYEARMQELAVRLECSYPPFGRGIFVGHGNESMILRDTLSMAIAIHDVNPEPYKYCAWLIYDQLIPVREFQYQSPRHSEGSSYGFCRASWEFRTEFLLRPFVGGQPVFNPNICSLRDYILHLYVPSGEYLPDGDNYSHVPYRDSQQIALAISTLTHDPLMKGEYLRAIRPNSDALFFLLVNDPELKPIYSCANEPLAIDTGAVRPSQILRTGWPKFLLADEIPAQNRDPDSLETVVELKGGGMNSRNHQHLDAGAFQIYYRGWQTLDLGIYGFYGTPYDMNFNKKSLSHNVLFVMDPDEPITGNGFNEGGQRMNPDWPRAKEDFLENEKFRTGTVLRSEILPDAMRPQKSIYSVDLTKAYSDKVEKHVRTFCWLNLEREDVPVALIVLDDVTVKVPNFEKSWQVNTPNEPTLTETGLLSTGRLPDGATIEPGRLSLTVLLPAAENRELKKRSVHDLPAEIQNQYANYGRNPVVQDGWQTRVYATKPNKTERFLNVLQVLAPNAEPLPVSFEETPTGVKVLIDGKSVEL